MSHSVSSKSKAASTKIKADPQASLKRKREPKFTAEENTFLFQQAGKKQRLLVERHGPANTEEKKNKFWEKLAKDVTALNGNKYIRTAASVKKKWTNTRCAAKAKVRTNANERRQAGGGVADIKPFTTTEEMFLQNMPVAPESVHGIPGSRDSNLKLINATPRSSIRKDLWAEVGRSMKSRVSLKLNLNGESPSLTKPIGTRTETPPSPILPVFSSFPLQAVIVDSLNMANGVHQVPQSISSTQVSAQDTRPVVTYCPDTQQDSISAEPAVRDMSTVVENSRLLNPTYDPYDSDDSTLPPQLAASPLPVDFDLEEYNNAGGRQSSCSTRSCSR